MIDMETLVVGPLQVNCYLFWDEDSKEALVVDPGEDASAIKAAVAASGAEVKAILNTHGHFDHVGANAALKEAWDVPIWLHEADVPLLHQAREHAAGFGLEVMPSPDPDSYLYAGQRIALGQQEIEVRHTPGHSPGGVVFVGPGWVVTGDTLFAGSIGRTDLPGGSGDELLASVRRELLTLPGETQVLPGHGPASSIQREKRLNPFFKRD